MGGPDGEILGTRSLRTDLTECQIFSCRPDLAQSISILSYDYCAFPYFFYYYIFFSGNKIAIGMFTYVAQFDRKLGIYIATKLFQLTSRKEPSNPSRTDRFFRHYSCHRVKPSFGNFLNSFTMKARPGSHGSYDKLIFHTISGLSCSKGG